MATETPTDPGRYAQLFAEVAAERTSDEEAWLVAARQQAFDQFLATGFPSRRLEAWKYSDMRHLAARNYTHPHPVSAGEALALMAPFTEESDITVAFIDGIFQPQLGKDDGDADVAVQALHDQASSEALRAAVLRTHPPMASPFTNLHVALSRSGAWIRIAPKSRPASRIHVVCLHTGSSEDVLIAPRLLIDAGELSEATIAITHISAAGGRGLSIAETDIELGAGARIECIQMQHLTDELTHVANTRIGVGRDAQLRYLEVATGGTLARSDLTVNLRAEGAEVSIDGIYAAAEKQHLDFHTSIEHLAPRATSKQLYKGLLADRAVGVFNGRIAVHPGAVGTNGKQVSRTLLLSDTAKMNTKPELEIANDDVKCSHGATVGQLSPMELFYLESRGIDPDEARGMLARGFLQEPIFSLEHAGTRAAIQQQLAAYCEKHLTQGGK
jgi:Fe-S cluster assembly protein SufD